MAKTDIQVLCTRSLDRLLLHKAANENIYIDTLSFIETNPVTDKQTQDAVAACAKQKIDVVFTSINSVEAVYAILPQQPDWRIWSTGGTTKEKVHEYFGEEPVKGTARNAKSIAEKIILSGQVKDLVFFCGDQRLDELPELLRANNITVKEIITYTTTLTPQYVDKNYDAVIFFSPSAVHSFFSDNTISTNTILFSIGNTTTATIQSYCANKIVTSEWPGKENMIDIIIGYYKT